MEENLITKIQQLGYNVEFSRTEHAIRVLHNGFSEAKTENFMSENIFLVNLLAKNHFFINTLPNNQYIEFTKATLDEKSKEAYLNLTDETVRILQMVESKNTNRLVVIQKDGTKVEADSFPGLSIKWQGKGSLVEIHEGARFNNSALNIGHQSYLSIGDSEGVGLLDNVHIWLGGAGAKAVELIIGKRFNMLRGGRIFLRDESNVSVKIGNDNMYSTDVLFQATDGHIIRNEEGQIINSAMIPSIETGDHVWIGRNVILNKNTKLADGVIVGSGSIVTKQFSQKNIAIGGNPAKVIKENLFWERKSNI